MILTPEHYRRKQLQPGYAETSTRRRPKQPTTIIVGETECSQAKCVGEAIIDGRAGWLAFRMPNRRYYFQYQPW